MASPFKYFRKHQKQAFVGLGVMAMISFIVLPVLLQYLGSGSTASVTFATSTLGNIGQQELYALNHRRQALANFYQTLGLEMYQQTQSNSGFPQLGAELQQMSEEAMVEEWIVARYMQKQGHHVTDAEVGEFLATVARGNSLDENSPKAMITEQIYQSALRNAGISDYDVKALIADELLVSRFRSSTMQSVRTLSPAAMFDWYNQFNRQMKIEVIPVSINEFTANIPEPSEKTLKKFFEENKFRDNNPNAAESGFSVPKQFHIQVVSYQESLAKPEEITDDEVQQYYEKNKEALYKIAPQTQQQTPTGLGNIPTPGMSGKLSMPPTLPQSDNTTVPTATPSATTEPAAIEPVTMEPVTPAPITTPEVKPENESSASGTEVPASVSAAPEEQPDTSTENQAESPAGLDQEEKKDGENEGKSSWNHMNAPIRFVSYQTEEASEPEVSAQDDAQPVAVSETAPQDAVESENPQGNLPSENAATESQPAENSAATALEVAPSATNPLATTTPAAPSATSVPAVNFNATLPLGTALVPSPFSSLITQYKLLDDALKTEIREKLALERLQTKLKSIENAMNVYYGQYVAHLQRPNAKLDSRPDLAALVRDVGFQYADLENVNSFNMVNKDLFFAQSMIGDSTTGGDSVYGTLFGRSGGVNQNKPYLAENWAQKTHYLFWVTDTSEEHIPKFNDKGIAEQVKERWAAVEASKPAKEKAEQLAEIAKKSGKSLIETFTSRENASQDVKTIVESEYFSFRKLPDNYFLYIYNGMPVPAQFGEVREKNVLPGESLVKNTVLKNLGQEFMEGVYDLNVGEIGVFANQSQDTFYLVRKAEISPLDDAAFTSYQAAQQFELRIYTQIALQQRNYELNQGLQKDVFAKTNFAWKVKPSEYQQQIKLESSERNQNGGADNRFPPGRNYPLNLPEF
ncbi:MAG: SurA N-terminal domain-containing protein [Planctomycetaceae bacterium]|jgi:bisphosphoglycerate-dependent phosphoglycerate mutase|nr:SurA N-terminal domain-containing protein [Planctomycetaceae bacterium]